MSKSNSFFKFEITQTTRVLLYKMEMGNGKRWLFTKEDSVNFTLQEIKHPEENLVKIHYAPNVLRFTTVNGYVYVVQDKPGDGAEVTFNGPVNALLTQSLMPRMTYVPETLQAMSDDMEDFASIAEFMEQREKRHQGRVNPQDKFGWRVNMKFNNELAPWLQSFNGGQRDKSKKKSGKFSRE